MNERRQILYHNSKGIIFIDHTNLSGAEYLRVVEESIETASASDMVDRLILVDSSGSVVDKEVMKALKRLTSKIASKTSKTAVLGLTGVQRMFANTLAKFSKTNLRSFSSREEALAWLTS